MSLLSVNVATLAKKLQDLLSAGFPLLVCSEIHVPLPSLRSVSRRAFSLGFSSVFSWPLLPLLRLPPLQEGYVCLPPLSTHVESFDGQFWSNGDRNLESSQLL